MFLESDELVLDYGKYYHLIRHFKPDFADTLIIGGAGYSFPMDYLRTYPNARIDVVEIDPQMTDIARKHFRMMDNERMRIFHEDGRMYINRAAKGQYDAILMDAFGSLFSVPHHLTTVEAVTQFHRILKDDGVIIFNLGAAISGEASKFFQAELATYREVFPQVHAFKVNLEYPDEKLQNLIIVASKSKNTPVLIEEALPTGTKGTTGSTQDFRGNVGPNIAALLSHRYTGDLPHRAEILTDDLAPVEYYNSVAQNLYLSNR